MTNMVAILGPSGVGKSSVCRVLVEQSRFFHVDFDANHPWESNGFPTDWDEDLRLVDFSLVAATVRTKITEGQYSAAVLSFATIHVFAPDRLAQAEAAGVVPVILWATEDQCTEARAARSQEHRVRFNSADRAKFTRKNRPAFEAFATETYARYRVEAFQPDGARWPTDHLPNICKLRMNRLTSRCS
jgi:gluconate kinase